MRQPARTATVSALTAAEEREHHVRSVLERARGPAGAAIERALDGIQRSHECYTAVREAMPAQTDRLRQYRQLVTRLRRGARRIEWFRELLQDLANTFPHGHGAPAALLADDLLPGVLALEREAAKHISRRAGTTKAPDDARWQFVWDVAVSLEDAGYAVRGGEESTLHRVLEECDTWDRHDAHAARRRSATPDLTAHTKPVAKLLRSVKAGLQVGDRLVQSWWIPSGDQMPYWNSLRERVSSSARATVLVGTLRFTLPPHERDEIMARQEQQLGEEVRRRYPW